MIACKSVTDQTIRDTVERPTFVQLVPHVANNFQISVEELTTISSQHHRPQQEISPFASSVLQIVKRCMALELKSEARDLLKAGLVDLPLVHTPFWAKWRSVMTFTKSLLELIKPSEVPEIHQIVSGFTLAAIQKASQYLASSRPQPPRDWSRPNAKRDNCTCQPCIKLKTFLMNPTHQVCRFSYPEKVRKHLERDTFDNKQDFIFDTERGRSPYTLVVTKTTNEYSRMLQAWNNDITDLRRQLGQMRNGFVHELLGGDILVQSGLEAELLRCGTAEHMGVQHPQALQPLSASAQNRPALAPVAGTKRKAHVVDLTEDNPF